MRRERLPVVEVDVDDESALAAIAEQVVAAIFELTGARSAAPKKKRTKKAKRAIAKKAKKAKRATAKKAKKTSR